MTEQLAACRTGADEVRLAVGRRWWFEYHCSESAHSQDAELWYHSHQKALVLSVEDHDADLTLSRQEREGCGMPIAYLARFDDGFESTVLDDELFDSPEGFYRPDPPRRRTA